MTSKLTPSIAASSYLKMNDTVQSTVTSVDRQAMQKLADTLEMETR